MFVLLDNTQTQTEILEGKKKKFQKSRILRRDTTTINLQRKSAVALLLCLSLNTHKILHKIQCESGGISNKDNQMVSQ